MRVLDVGCFDGFYAFLAERRGAERVVAVDNEEYRLWVASRWGVELEGGEGFRAVHGLLGSGVEYRRMDAFALAGLEERFDLVYCFGILHRVENPLGLLRVLRGRTVSGGTVLVETYGVGAEDRNGPAVRVFEPGEVYARDGFVYWGFATAGLERLARIAGFSRAESLINVEVDGHPRILGQLIWRDVCQAGVGELPHLRSFDVVCGRLGWWRSGRLCATRGQTDIRGFGVPQDHGSSWGAAV